MQVFTNKQSYTIVLQNTIIVGIDTCGLGFSEVKIEGD